MTELQLPAHLANRQSRGLADAARSGLSTGSPPYISIKGNRFTLVDAAGNLKPLNQMDDKTGALCVDVVLVDANPHVSKVYYDQAFNPSAAEGVPPACWSDNGQAPSSQATKPQAGACGPCPLNQWGSETSRITGKGVKACTDSKKLAVILPGESMPFLFRVPPGSLKNFGAYVDTIKGQSMGNRQVDLSDLVLRISFSPDGVGLLDFRAVAWVDEKTAGIMEQLWATGTGQTAALVGKNDIPRQGALVAPPVSPPAAVPPPPQVQHAAPGNSVAAPPPPPAQVSPAPSEPAPKRRGRPKAAETAQTPNLNLPGGQVAAQAPVAPFLRQEPAAASQQADPLAIPAFLRRGGEQPAPAAPPAAQHGIVSQPPAPDANLMAALQSALALPV